MAEEQITSQERNASIVMAGGCELMNNDLTIICSGLETFSKLELNEPQRLALHEVQGAVGRIILRSQGMIRYANSHGAGPDKKIQIQKECAR